jgi:hypothetical protein
LTEVPIHLGVVDFFFLFDSIIVGVDGEDLFKAFDFLLGGSFFA